MQPIKTNAGLLSVLKFSFVSFDGGFKFQSCAIPLSVHSKTSWDASKDLYHAFPSQNNRFCSVIGNVK
jgi:hypothetical protein